EIPILGSTGAHWIAPTGKSSMACPPQPRSRRSATSPRPPPTADTSPASYATPSCAARPATSTSPPHYAPTHTTTEPHSATAARPPRRSSPKPALLEQSRPQPDSTTTTTPG